MTAAAAQSAEFYWISEEIDEHGDITDVRHYDSYASAKADKPEGGSVALVRDNDGDLRLWAYVKDGALSQHLCDSHEKPVTRTPKRFLDEFRRAGGAA